MERKKVCSVMDCQKLSREACAHAAQNERLPVQNVVQVLYYEQQRLRETSDGGVGGDSPSIPAKPNPTSKELDKLQRENEELKLEVVKLKMKVKEIEKYALRSPSSSPGGANASPFSDKPPLPRKSLINSVSKKLGRLYVPKL